MKKYRVRYSALFVNSPELTGEFKFDAENEIEAHSKASKIMMAKAKELKVDAFRMNIEEVPE